MSQNTKLLVGDAVVHVDKPLGPEWTVYDLALSGRVARLNRVTGVCMLKTECPVEFLVRKPRRSRAGGTRHG